MGGREGSARQPETERQRVTVTWIVKKNKTEEATWMDGITADTNTACRTVKSERLHKARAGVVNNKGGEAEGDAVLMQGTHNINIFCSSLQLFISARRRSSREEG